MTSKLTFLLLILSWTLVFALPAPTIRQDDGKLCKSNADCEGNDQCFPFGVEACDSDDSQCYCLPAGLSQCDSNSECDDDSECFEISGSKFCVPSPILDLFREAGVCIAIDHLDSFNTDELVFSEHRKASVLCDRDENCATAGHIVVWNGKGMMMKSYCDLIGGCAEKTTMVNSPKWRRGLRVRGKGEGLEFAALAARYETRAEEAVMDLAVRMGI